MRGEWKIKNEALRVLWEEAQDLAAGSARCGTRPFAASTTSLRIALSTRRSTPLADVRRFSVEERRSRLARRHFLASPARDPVELAGGLVGLHATDPVTVYLSARARGRTSPSPSSSARSTRSGACCG